jgi:GntR family transcriptional regulator
MIYFNIKKILLYVKKLSHLTLSKQLILLAFPYPRETNPITELDNSLLIMYNATEHVGTGWYITRIGMAKPLYQQVIEKILVRIHEGELHPGEKLPSEHDLSEMYSVGRNTIRHALSDLAAQGYIETVQGVGSFVSESHTPKTAEFLYGFSREMALREKHVTSDVLDARIIEADPFLARRLRIQLGAEVVFLYRLRILEGEATAIERAYLPHALCPGILEHDFTQESLYDILSRRYKMDPDHADQEIGAELATDQVADLLALETPAVVLVIRRETYTAADQVIEYVESEFRADRFRFYTHLKLSGASEAFQRYPIRKE